MKWERVRGHDNIIASFATAWQRDRLGHAYLFVGPAGVGKHTLARELARAVLCESRQADLRACGRCPSCKLTDAGTHPDLSLVRRPEEKVAFSVDDIRELIEHLSLKPARGRRKVAIVDDADDFNAEAANAFLKTLEEPSPGSVLILIGGPTPERQFSTILSRCQVVSFKPLPNADIAELLRAHGKVDPSEVERLVRVAGGSIGQALALDDDALWEFRQKMLVAIAAESIDAAELSKQWTEFAALAGKEAGQKRRRAALALKLLIGMLQDALRIHHGIAPIVAKSAEAATLGQLASRIGPDSLMSWIDRATETDVQIDRMVQVDLAVEAFCDALARPAATMAT